ncbi:MAG: PIN domain-containing protein [Bacteroidetes bacterium CHB5]|nr:PIN domain-containing protein [Bacteroidetes bacterium CHB5]
MKIFLDANVLVTVLNKEYPVFPYAAKLLSLADQPRYTLVTSPICLALAFYFAEKKSGRAVALKKMKLLCSKIDIAAVDAEVVMQTLANKTITDFEDGLEYYTAEQNNCSCFITEDADFFFSEMEVLRVEEFLVKYGVKDES